MIGNAHDAALALAGDAPILSNDGGTRYVYLINGVVYKVERNEYWKGTNAFEYENIKNGSLPTGAFYPQVSLYSIDGNDVIAMEYVEGTAIYECVCEYTGDECDSVCMTHSERAFLIPIVSDTSGMNVIRTDNGYYVIDVA